MDNGYVSFPYQRKNPFFLEPFFFRDMPNPLTSQHSTVIYKDHSSERCNKVTEINHKTPMF